MDDKYTRFLRFHNIDIKAIEDKVEGLSEGVAGVSSVNGRTGAVVLGVTDIPDVAAVYNYTKWSDVEVPGGLAPLGPDGKLKSTVTPTASVMGVVGSITAADSTVTVAGTASNPTIKVGTIAESQVTNLVTDLSNKVTKTAPITLNYAASVATDASASNHFRITLTGNLTLANPTNPADGQRIIWELIQGGTGSYTLTLGTAFALGSDIPTITLSTAVGKRDFLGAVYNSATSKWYVIAFTRGY